MNDKQIKALLRALTKKAPAKRLIKANPKAKLVKLMGKHNYKVTAEKAVSYKTKAGIEKEGLKLTFSNGKDYMVGSHRFWKC